MHFRSKYLFAVWAVLCLGLCLTTSACSDKDRESNPIVTKGANVSFTFDLAAAKTGEVPVEVKGFEFLGYTDEDMPDDSLAVTETVAKTDPNQADTQIVVLEDVPLNVVIFRVNFLSENGTVLESYKTKPLNLVAGTTVEAELVADDPPAPTEIDVTLNITNAYALNIPQAKYEVELVSSAGETVPVSGETAYTVSGDTGSCTIICQVPEDEYSVAAVKLLNPANDIAFEWLTYAKPQALKDNAADLDVANNKFADTAGDGSQDHPFLVGNPRQLDNLHDYCAGEKKYCVEQIADIDFEGSCGITIEAGYDKDNNIVATPKTVDETARFYNKDKAGEGALGWFYIGGDEEQAGKHPFCGSYNGNGHVIDGIVAYNPDAIENASLFGLCYMDKISGLTIGANSSFLGAYSAGIIAYLLGSETSIDNCTVEATVCAVHVPGLDDTLIAGGICSTAEANVTFENCAFTGKMYCGGQEGYVGGIVGWLTSGDTMLENHSDAQPNAHNANTATAVRNCKVSGQFYCDSNGTMCGGLVERITGEVALEACQVTATYEVRQVQAEDVFAHVGGLVNTLNCNDCALGSYKDNVLAMTFDCSQVNASADDDALCVGGVFVQVLGKSQDEVKTALTGNVDISGNKCKSATGTKFVYRKYCVDPDIDSLDD